MTAEEEAALALEVHRTTTADRTLATVYARTVRAKGLTTAEAIGIIPIAGGDVNVALRLVRNALQRPL